jgi:hypothetical protein
MWWMTDMALSYVLLRRGALSSEVARVTTVEVGVSVGRSSGRWRRQV